MNASDFFAAVEERQASESAHYRRHWGLDLRALSHDEAQRIIRESHTKYDGPMTRGKKGTLRTNIDIDVVKLRDLMADQGWRSHRLAVVMGWERSYIAQCLRNLRGNLERMESLARTLGDDSFILRKWSR